MKTKNKSPLRSPSFGVPLPPSSVSARTAQGVKFAKPKKTPLKREEL